MLRTAVQAGYWQKLGSKRAHHVMHCGLAQKVGVWLRGLEIKLRIVNQSVGNGH